jgi:hypothetical protein
MMTATTTATTRTLPPAWGAYEYMAEADRVCKIRYAQGWDADPEYGWGGQCPITKQWLSESEWEDEGLLPLPEDYSAFDTALVNWLREGDATYEGCVLDLHLFNKIALAHCAMTRARIHVLNNERWDGEYYTAKLWGERR